MTFFKKDDCICLVERNEGESMEHFIDRGNFIVAQKPQNDKEYELVLKYSYIYTNVKYLHCEYTDDIMTDLKKMEDKIFVT